MTRTSTRRLRFWLAVLDLVHRAKLPRSVYLWVVGRCSNCVDWSDP